MKRKKVNRKSRAQKAADRISYLGMALGAVLVAVIVTLFLLLKPVYSVRDMAIAQVVHNPVIDPPSNLAPTSPIQGSSIEASPNETKSMESEKVRNAPHQTIVDTTERIESNLSKPQMYREIGFERLSSFSFEVTEAMLNNIGDASAISLTIKGQIPSVIKDLNNQRVAVKGFMLPLNIYGGQTTEFLLLKNQGMCCYGKVPKMNEWVTVHMPGMGVEPVMDRVVTVTGTLRVGEIRDDGLLTAIYHLDGAKMEVVSSP